MGAEEQAPLDEGLLQIGLLLAAAEEGVVVPRARVVELGLGDGQNGGGEHESEASDLHCSLLDC